MKKEIILFLVIGLVAKFVHNKLNALHSRKGKQSAYAEKDYQIAYVVPPKLELFGNASFKLKGLQYVSQQAITQHWLLGLAELYPYMLGMFEEKNKPQNGNLLPWSGEFAGKHLTGGIALYRLNCDPELKQILNGIVNRLCDFQTSSGYLGSWSKEYELTPLVQWQSPKLIPGKHEFVIEVLKECNPASKVNWARLRELRLNSLPILDARTLQLAVAPDNSKRIPWLRFTASDAQGRKIELEDFDSAGKNSGYYYTWLPLEGLDKGVFSYTNPLRSVRPQ